MRDLNKCNHAQLHVLLLLLFLLLLYVILTVARVPILGTRNKCNAFVLAKFVVVRAANRINIYVYVHLNHNLFTTGIISLIPYPIAKNLASSSVTMSIYVNCETSENKSGGGVYVFILSHIN